MAEAADLSPAQYRFESYEGHMNKDVTISEDEILVIIAALNFTKNRTVGKSWEDKDERLLQRMKWLLDNKAL